MWINYTSWVLGNSCMNIIHIEAKAVRVSETSVETKLCTVPSPQNKSRTITQINSNTSELLLLLLPKHSMAYKCYLIVFTLIN
jgi:hypothetical protein